MALISIILPFILVCFVWMVANRTGRRQLPHYIRGPKPVSWLLGSKAEIAQSEAGAANGRWKKKYGLVYKYSGCFGREYLVLNDPNAMQHVFRGQNLSYEFEQSIRAFLRLISGEGLVYQQGREHTRQRKLLQPAFSPSYIKGLVPKFAGCACRLVNVLNQKIICDGRTDGTWDTNAYHWVELLAMESFGSAAFGVRFGGLEGEEHEIMTAYGSLMSTSFSCPSKLNIVLNEAVLCIPSWLIAVTDKLPLTAVKKIQYAMSTVKACAIPLIEQKRRQLAADTEIRDQDLLSVLVQASMTTNKAKVAPLTDEEIYHQLTVFLIAGYETSVNTVGLALIEIARDQDVQDRLHAEIISVLGTSKDGDLVEGMDSGFANKMPYLTAVVNETLRLHATVHSLIFVATEDNIMPLSQPIRMEDGSEVKAIPISKGQRVMCHMDGFNRLEEVWGPDAAEFRPERWIERAEDAVKPEDGCGGPYANLANFGGGPKVCIGVLEAQVFIAVLLREFEVRISKPDYELWRDGSFVGTIPMQKHHLEEGPQVPLRIRRRQAPN